MQFQAKPQNEEARADGPFRKNRLKRIDALGQLHSLSHASCQGVLPINSYYARIK